MPVTFYTDGAHGYRGAGGLFLGTAGPQFMGDVSEYRCFFYRPQSAPTLSIDDPRWDAAVARALGDPDWTSSFPEEAFELGVAVARRAWLEKSEVVNTWPLAKLEAWARRAA